MVSLRDESIICIIPCEMSSQSNVATSGDKLFFTNEKNHEVICCDYYGNLLWTFGESSYLIYSYGISVDNDGNVYVAGAHSNNVVVISADSQRHRQLLSKKDGLDCPTALEYD